MRQSGGQTTDDFSGRGGVRSDRPSDQTLQGRRFYSKQSPTETAAVSGSDADLGSDRNLRSRESVVQPPPSAQNITPSGSSAGWD